MTNKRNQLTTISLNFRKKLYKSKTLNEATYILGKFKNQKKDLENIISSIKMNISDSAEYDDSKTESDKALKDIDVATNNFIKALEKAIKPIGNNYAGA